MDMDHVSAVIANALKTQGQSDPGLSDPYHLAHSAKHTYYNGYGSKGNGLTRTLKRKKKGDK